eukprot:149197-Hanusia_phi.AAC.2
MIPLRGSLLSVCRYSKTYRRHQGKARPAHERNLAQGAAGNQSSEDPLSVHEVRVELRDYCIQEF